ncbi:hypothetical protein JTE90_019424 [Oedothorax gibbosus]|uniref:THAP-type domain-containing protein n=1 Tax=Oedothorax gibbosus TaxID=931172 RepID=A0AAV6TUE8_9ARAC|nr:hypothetical protein JTE90_019424 [Oedothorax gibbosus]
MGRKCCVPGCNSNYDNTNVHSFAFPKDDRKSLWIKKINRAGFVPTKHSVVCIKHFSEQFFIHNHRVVKPDGTVLEVKRNMPILTSDAFPSLLTNSLVDLHEDPAPKRKAPEERLAEMRKRDDDNFANWNEKDIITSCSRLSGCCRSKIPKELQFI